MKGRPCPVSAQSLPSLCEVSHLDCKGSHWLFEYASDGFSLELLDGGDAELATQDGWPWLWVLVEEQQLVHTLPDTQGSVIGISAMLNGLQPDRKRHCR